VMAMAGGTLGNLVYLLQNFAGRGQTAGYVEERRGYFPTGVPTSTGTAATRLATPGALIHLDAVGIIPAPGMRFDYLGGTSKNASYSNALSYGDIVHFSGVMTNAAETRPDPELWFGSAVKNEIRLIMNQKLAAVLKDAGCAASDIVVANLHLLNPRDDYGPLCEVIDEFFPHAKPVFTVSPSSGLGAQPGRIEISPVAVRKGGATVVADVSVPGGAGMLGGPQAKRVGDLVYIGTQSAGNRYGRLADAAVVDPRAVHFRDQVAAEMDEIITRIEAICGAAGTGTDNLVRLRLFVCDIARAPAAVAVIRQRIGEHVPLSIVEDAEALGWLGQATISADAVAYVAQA